MYYQAFDVSKIEIKDKQNVKISIDIFEIKEYKADTYTIKYNKDWNLIPKVDTSRVGTNSIYLGTLALDIPSTTNSEYTSSLYVKVTDEDTTLEKFATKIRKENTMSVSEYFEEKSSSEVQFKNEKGYAILSETADGEKTISSKTYLQLQMEKFIE